MKKSNKLETQHFFSFSMIFLATKQKHKHQKHNLQTFNTFLLFIFLISLNNKCIKRSNKLYEFISSQAKQTTQIEISKRNLTWPNLTLMGLLSPISSFSHLSISLMEILWWWPVGQQFSIAILGLTAILWWNFGPWLV